MLNTNPEERPLITDLISDPTTSNTAYTRKASIENKPYKIKVESIVFKEDKVKNSLVLPQVMKGSSIASKMILPSSKFFRGNSFIKSRKSHNSSMYLDKKEKENKLVKRDSLEEKLNKLKININVTKPVNDKNKPTFIKKSMFFLQKTKY